MLRAPSLRLIFVARMGNLRTQYWNARCVLHSLSHARQPWNRDESNGEEKDGSGDELQLTVAQVFKEQLTATSASVA